MFSAKRLVYLFAPHCFVHDDCRIRTAAGAAYYQPGRYCGAFGNAFPTQHCQHQFDSPAADTVRLEISRGCPAFCTFCHEAWERRPYREIPAAAALAAARRLARETGATTVEVSAFNFNTHREMAVIVDGLHRIFDRVNFMSQRADVLARHSWMLPLELAAEKRSFTVGVEGISQRMRHFYAKGLTEAELLAVLENLAAPDDVDAPGYVDPQVKTDLASRKMYSQSTMVFHPGDCLWFNYDDSATPIDERRYVYEVAGQPTGPVTMSVITPEQNSWTLAKAMRKASGALPLAGAGTRAVPLYVRRIFYADYHRGYIDASRLPASDPYYTGSTPLAFRLPEPKKENAAGNAIGDGYDYVNSGTRIHGQRVATLDDVEFARKVHEMCIRWAVAYASENPYDWGAPRPANRPTMMDQPLAMFDIFAASGAARRPDATARVMGSASPFYRFIMPGNPQAQPYWRTVVGSPSQAAVMPIAAAPPSRIAPARAPNTPPRMWLTGTLACLSASCVRTDPIVIRVKAPIRPVIGAIASSTSEPNEARNDPT